MDEPNESFGLRLRRSRKARDLTQEQLAERVSCSRYTIRKIEADERRPSRRLAERLLHRLEIPIPERDAFIAAARGLRLSSPEVDPTTPSDGGGDAAGDRPPPWVGRGDDYRLLCSLLQRLGGGRGHVALVEGEPGIGKSRSRWPRRGPRRWTGRP